MKIQKLTYLSLKTILILFFLSKSFNCVAQYNIDTLKISGVDYTDSVLYEMKNNKINAVIESIDRRLYFNLRNSKTHFTNIHFFKNISGCLAVVSDKNYMKPKNEIEIYSLKGDSTIRTSNIDSITNVIEISNKNYHLLFIEAYATEVGEQIFYYDVITVNKETCTIQYNGFSKFFSVPKNDDMEIVRNCSIDIYIKDEKLYLDYNCLKHEVLNKHKKTFIFSEKKGKFILNN
ncbi:hypothetical protein WAF17_08500 [Bernardetia sp. ABR2-2B]|uniref:hypothetical protein n=1 Tax=Bernardetia sp. ABR2-2B TaxID=3127472 RepID=UPI0030D08BCA